MRYAMRITLDEVEDVFYYYSLYEAKLAADAFIHNNKKKEIKKTNSKDYQPTIDMRTLFCNVIILDETWGESICSVKVCEVLDGK